MITFKMSPSDKQTYTQADVEELKSAIRDVPDFPKKGIIFKDITTLLKQASLFQKAIQMMASPFENEKIDAVVGIDARGFILGGPIATLFDAGFVPVRKKGKLPAEVMEVTYSLEYGQDTVAIHKDAFTEGNRVLVVDDLLATGGTLMGSCELIEKIGGKIVGISSLIELTFLKAQEKFSKYNYHSVIQY